MVNEQIYGLKNLWPDCYYQQDILTYKNKKAFFEDAGIEASSMLFKGVINGKLTYTQPIDNSLSYCGLGTECALSHVSYISTDPSDPSTVTIIHTQDRNITNFTFFEKNGGNVNPIPASINQIQLNALNNLIWTDSYSTTNISPYLSPYTLVDPHNIVLLINLFCRSAQGVTISTTLQSYIDNNYKDTYPQIIGVTIEAYFGNDTIGRSQTAGKGVTNFQIPFILGILDPYEFNDFNANIYAFGSNVVYGSQVYNNIYINYDISGNYVTPCYTTERGKQYIRCGNDGAYKYLYIAYYDGIIEDILSTVACFGLFFTGDAAAAQNGALTDPKMYVGILGDDGIGHGVYTQGSDNAAAPQNEWRDMSDSGYDPDAEHDPTRYTNDTYFYGQFSSRAFTKMYVLTDSQVSDLADELYTAVSMAPQGEEIERYNQSVFLTQNPIDCIISLKKFPMNLPYSAAVPMKLGSYTTSVNAAPLLYNTGIYSFLFTESSLNTLHPWYDKSFLDYEPYTRCEVSIPFCGTVEIPATYIYDYGSIQVDLIVDFITGACTGYVRARGITIDSVSGSCSVTMPVNGLQQSTLDSQIHSAALAKDKMYATGGMAILGGIAAIGLGIATGGASVAIMGALAAVGGGLTAYTTNKQIDYQLEHMDTPLKQISAASGAIAQSYDMRCKMRITRPKLSDSYKRPGTETAASGQEIYARTIGHACLLQGIVSDFSGLTAGQIQLDGVNAPEPVKEMIKNIFAQGVYL